MDARRFDTSSDMNKCRDTNAYAQRNDGPVLGPVTISLFYRNAKSTTVRTPTANVASIAMATMMAGDATSTRAVVV